VTTLPTRAGEPFAVLRPEPALVAWLVASLLVVLLITAGPVMPFVMDVPQSFVVPLAEWVSAAMAWFTDSFRGLFRATTWLMSWPLGWVRGFLQWLPWPAAVVLCAVIGLMAGGWRLAAFSALALLYTVVIGYWDKTAATLALAGVAVPISILTGLFIGILGHRMRLARRVIEPLLDLMQTIPTFAYLVPILVLFGVGPVVGMTASAIYAMPPMVRNVLLGLDRVPVEIVESGEMSGSTERQLLWWVKLPAALPTLLLGVNQTIMAGFSMVVIAAMVGGTEDIGLEVFTTMKKAQFGESLLAGLVIALLAMIMDRASRGFAERRKDPRLAARGAAQRRLAVWALWGAVAVLLLFAEMVPGVRDYPRAWVFYPAEFLNRALEWFTVTFFWLTSALKTAAIFFLLLPLKLGLEQVVRPRFWGFEMDATAKLVYLLLFLGATPLLARLSGWRVALGVAIAGLLYYFGTTGLPWTVVTLIVALLAYQTSGPRVCLFTIASLSFIAFTGVWRPAMETVQLCGAGVIVAFVLGSGLGIWAALNDRVSAFLRPINDTLQTMPIFVFLIPAVMVFLVGEFTAFIAVIMYAIVPSIRYTEHGIRNVPAHVVEAARSFGATRFQLLRQAQLPMALPEIMLGLNQTIMMGLAMVIVAALVGAKGLGTEVMVALTWADTGKGAVSGLSVALIAIVADRIIQSWCARKKKALGLD